MVPHHPCAVSFTRAGARSVEIYEIEILTASGIWVIMTKAFRAFTKEQ
jgi:hypothetical protein